MCRGGGRFNGLEQCGRRRSKTGSLYSTQVSFLRRMNKNHSNCWGAEPCPPASSSLLFTYLFVCTDRCVAVPLDVLWSCCPKVSVLSGSVCNLRYLLMDEPNIKLSQDGSAVLVNDYEEGTVWLASLPYKSKTKILLIDMWNMASRPPSPSCDVLKDITFPGEKSIPTNTRKDSFFCDMNTFFIHLHKCVLEW